MMYGISQNPDTKNYSLVPSHYFDYHCVACGKIYTNIVCKWCKPCQLKYLGENFTNWTSGNEIIDNFIQEMRLKINSCYNIIFEWIPYNQLDKIEEIGKYDSFTVYSAKWKDGPLYWNKNNNRKYIRDSDKTVVLKCLCNSQNIIDLLNEV